MGLAALSVGGKISWLNVYADGSGLANTLIPVGNFERCWVAAAGYQGTAIVGGIMLMFRRSNFAARLLMSLIGFTILLTCLLFVRNTFGLVILIMMGLLLIATWKLPPFWVGELFALLAATTCLNSITSIHVLFFVSEQSIGGVVRSSDATAMQEVTRINSQVWATLWMVLSFFCTLIGIFCTFETLERDDNVETRGEFQDEDRPFALTELA